MEEELDLQGLDHAKCDRLVELVEELTTSGKETLDEDAVKELKKICKCVFYMIDVFWFEYDLRQKYYASHVRPNLGFEHMTSRLMTVHFMSLRHQLWPLGRR